MSTNVVPVAFPDHRYRTVLMWWDRETFADLAVMEQLPASSIKPRNLAFARDLTVWCVPGEIVNMDVPHRPSSEATAHAAILLQDGKSEDRLRLAQTAPRPQVAVIDRRISLINDLKRLRPTPTAHELAEPR